MKRKHIYVIGCLLMIPVCIFAQSQRTGSFHSHIPEYYNKYISDSGIFVADISEYSDVVIISKSIRSVISAKRENSIKKVERKGLEKKESINLLKFDCKTDKVFDRGTFNKKPYCVSALTTTYGSNLRWDLCVDILADRCKGKPVIVRYVHRIPYRAGGRWSGEVVPLPVKASLNGAEVLRLEYRDGAVEHWKYAPGFIDRAQNYYRYGTTKNPYGNLNRNLLWWNKKGEGSFFMSLCPEKQFELYKAWNYSDSAKEPVYK